MSVTVQAPAFDTSCEQARIRAQLDDVTAPLMPDR
jgi:hypothetical protein